MVFRSASAAAMSTDACGIGMIFHEKIFGIHDCTAWAWVNVEPGAWAWRLINVCIG
jgi:hypothetical protein